MAKDPLATTLAQATIPGTVTAPGGKKVPPPKGVQKAPVAASPIGKNPPPPPKAGKAKK